MASYWSAVFPISGHWSAIDWPQPTPSGPPWHTDARCLDTTWHLPPNGLTLINTLRSRQSGHHFADIFKCVSLPENLGILIRISFNSLGPSDAIWRHKSGSTLAQVMACCLTAPSHYLNQCWLIISKVLWHSSEGNFIRDTSATIH